jgi:hypothetical protein
MATSRRTAGGPDWANFRPLGKCLLWAGFSKITEVANIFWLLFPRYALSLTKMGWATFWATFSQTHLVTVAPKNLFVLSVLNDLKQWLLNLNADN